MLAALLNRSFSPQNASCHAFKVVFRSFHRNIPHTPKAYLESRLPVMALYRPPKLKWLEPVMQAGRVRGEGAVHPAEPFGIPRRGKGGAI